MNNPVLAFILTAPLTNTQGHIIRLYKLPGIHEDMKAGFGAVARMDPKISNSSHWINIFN